MDHALIEAVAHPGHGLALDGRKIEQPGVVGDVTGQGVPAQVGAVLPLGGVGVAGARVPGVEVLDLVLEGGPLVHGSYNYRAGYITISSCS